jgi:coxsackievirus/adenovirus receptor
LACTRIFAPICGDDGKTYPSACRMNAENCESNKVIKKASDGPCDPAPEPEPAPIKTAVKTVITTTTPAAKTKKS